MNLSLQRAGIRWREVAGLRDLQHEEDRLRANGCTAGRIDCGLRERSHHRLHCRSSSMPQGSFMRRQERSRSRAQG